MYIFKNDHDDDHDDNDDNDDDNASVFWSYLSLVS